MRNFSLGISPPAQSFNIHISRGYKAVPFVSILLLAFYARLFVCPSHCFMTFYLHIFACFSLETRIHDFYVFVDSAENAEEAAAAVRKVGEALHSPRSAGKMIGKASLELPWNETKMLLVQRIIRPSEKYFSTKCWM